MAWVKGREKSVWGKKIPALTFYDYQIGAIPGEMDLNIKKDYFQLTGFPWPSYLSLTHL